jgi:hypothetical protein
MREIDRADRGGGMNDVISIEEKKHHRYGGSTSHIWVNCHGWASLVATLPDIPPSKAAERGTYIHALCESRVRMELDHLYKGTPRREQRDLEPDVKEFVDNYWNTLWKEDLEEIVTGKQILLEKKLMLSEELDAGGTADVLIVQYDDKGELIIKIIDIKTGYHRVEPDSEQFIFYSVCAMDMIEKKHPKLKVARAKCCVYQPTHEEPYTYHWFKRSQLEKARARYIKAINASRSPKPKFKVGEWCEWCKAKPVCTAFKKDISRKIEVDLEGMDAVELPTVTATTDEQIVKVIRYGRLVENFISQTRKHALWRFKQGNPVKGLKVVEGTVKRRWIDDEAAMKELELLGLQEPWKKKVIGIGEAEKLLGKGKVDHLTVKKGAPLVVLEDDSRPALPDATSMLDAFDDDSEC